MAFRLRTSFASLRPGGAGGFLARVPRRQAAWDESAAGAVLSAAEMRHVHRAVETKALEALAVGNLPPGRELELISALDLGTVPWSQLPIRFKERLGLPLQEHGIKSESRSFSISRWERNGFRGKALFLNRGLVHRQACSKILGTFFCSFLCRTEASTPWH